MLNSGTVKISSSYWTPARRSVRPEARSRLPVIHIVILLAAFLNAMLRLNEESNITLFRLMIPFILAYCLSVDTKRFSQMAMICAALVVSQTVSFAFTPYEFNIDNAAFAINYLTMVFFGFYVYILHLRYGNIATYNALSAYFYLLIVVLLGQYFLKFQFPNIPPANEAVNGWYGNENDASLTLASFIFFCARFEKLKKHAIGIVAAVVLMNINGSRACMLSVAILFIYVTFRKYGIARASYLFLAAVTVGIAYISYFHHEFDIVAESLKFLEQFGSSLRNLFKLDIGQTIISSLDVRSAAAVLAITDFIHYPLFGTGAGNTIALVTRNGAMFNYVVQSIHNMPLMLLAELGIVGVAIMAFPMVRASSLNKANFLFWFGIFLFSSLSESGGFITNFFALASFVLVIASPDLTVGGRKASPKYAGIYHLAAR